MVTKPSMRLRALGDPACPSICDAQMKATVAEFPYQEGILGVQMALRLIGCQAIPPWVISPQATITAENVKDFPNPPAFKP